MNVKFFPYPDQDIIVLFDYLMADSRRVIELSPHQELIYSELISFVRGRLIPLKDQIIADQVLNSSVCMVFIEAPTVGIQVNFSYSESLRQKAVEAFSPGDFDYLFDKISRQLLT